MSKKTAKLCLFALVMGTLGTMAFATACKTETPKPQLLAPEISAQDDGIFWTSAKNASGYKVRLNDGEWQNVSDEEKSVDYPTEEGSYTLQVVSIGSGYSDSAPVEFSFYVDALTIADCTQTDNALTFTNEHVYYSVNDGEYAALSENKTLDFSAAAVGTEYTVEYYSKGGFWQESNATYYLDSEIKTKNLTVTATLAAPVLTVNEDNTGITWTAVENAVSYQVTVDGVATTVQATENLAVAFPTSVGAHTITVKALENGNYKQSAESTYEMETKAFGIPQVTYDPDAQTIGWDAKYTDYMLSSTGGDYTNVNGSQIAYTTGLSLKLAQHYDETAHVLYLDSKTLGFQTRETPEITFSAIGTIAWGAEDVGSALNYYYSVTATDEDDAFGRTTVNNLDVSAYETGSYTFKVYGANYVEETLDAAILWLSSANSEITFNVLGTPKLDYTTNTLLWAVDENATAYQCKVGDSDEWITATETGAFEATEFTIYYVKAIGSETVGNYVVNSGVSSLYFDPALKTVGSSTELATFTDEKYLVNVGASLEGNSTGTGAASIVTTSEDSAEQAILAGAEDGKVLKLTAGNAAPRNQNEWGNSDGLSFNFFTGLDVSGGGTLIVRMYMVGNSARETGYTGVNDGTGNYMKQETNIEGLINYLVSGKSQFYSGWSQETTVNEWVDYEISIPASWSDPTAYTFSINFHDNGKAGDAIYIDSIKYVDTRTSELVIDFSTYTEVPAFVSCDVATAITDGQLTNVTTLWSGKSMVVSYKAIALKAGSTITVTATTVGNGMNIDLNGTYYKWVSANTTSTVTITLTEDFTLKTIAFRCTSANGATYKIASIVIEPAKEVELAPLNLDFSQYTEVPEFVSCDVATAITDGQLTNVTTLWNTKSMVVSYKALALKTGDTITVTATTVGNGMNIDLNGTYYKWVSANTTSTVTITITEAMTLETIAFRCTSANGATYKIASVVINTQS